MTYNFLRGDRDQPFLLPPDLRDWLPDGHLAWFILDVQLWQNRLIAVVRSSTLGTSHRGEAPDGPRWRRTPRLD
jgi:hypothetical protein